MRTLIEPKTATDLFGLHIHRDIISTSGHTPSVLAEKARQEVGA